MENLAVAQKYSPVPYSPNRHYSSNSSSSSSSSPHHHHPPPSPAAVPVTRSEPNNPYPTTFVQADTTSFKQVVQMLTGSSDTTRVSARPDTTRCGIPPIKNGPRKDKSGSKLYERRNSLKNFRISPLGPGTVNGARAGSMSGYSGSPRPGAPDILSPSVLDFPSLALSPVTPLIPDPFNRRGSGSNCDRNLDKEAEERAIQEKGFYLHRSPASTPRDSEPRLLPLFPVTSPRVSGDS